MNLSVWTPLAALLMLAPGALAEDDPPVSVRVDLHPEPSVKAQSHRVCIIISPPDVEIRRCPHVVRVPNAQAPLLP